MSFRKFFGIMVLAHWAEHAAQMSQVYLQGVPRHHALGLLGWLWPSLMHTEGLHYAYALAMWLGLGMLCNGFRRCNWLWTVAFVIQTWHLLEHSLLLYQASWLNLDDPTSIIQLFMPKIELHAFYTSIVSAPLLYVLWDNREARVRALAPAPVASPDGQAASV